MLAPPALLFSTTASSRLSETVLTPGQQADSGWKIFNRRWRRLRWQPMLAGSLRLLAGELEAGHIGFRIGEHEPAACTDRREQGLVIGIARGLENQLRRAIGAGAEPASAGRFSQVCG